MDEFDLDHIELTGSTISMEFGQGGRIQQLWVAESATQEGTQEFQFVCPPIDMGEEATEDYFPGTILLGARTSPDEPWIVSRNANAIRAGGDDFSPTSVGFEYEFSFLDELAATGRFYEIPGPVPQIAWEVRLVNRARRSVEIGELAFPLALNNVYEGFPRTDDGTRELFHDRVYVHKFMGGSASHVYAQRMNGRPPGLLIFPGEDTRWEFFNHVTSSLTTPYRWEGIPMVYVHSRAAFEREGWPEWFASHSSLVLEPGDERTYHMRFASAERFQPDSVFTTLAAAGRPVIGLFPSAVVPVGVPITVEVAGTTPTRFQSDVEAELESDADEEGGSCTVKVSTPGPVKLVFEDTLQRQSETSLLFTERIDTLIEKRADWIVKHQMVKEPGPLQHAIVAGNGVQSEPVTDPEMFVTPFGIESGLADALYLAEKNSIYPVRRQIEALNSYVQNFLERRVVNPGNWSIGCMLPNPNAVAVHTGRPQVYVLVYLLYDSLARIAEGYGGVKRSAAEFRECREHVWRSLLRNCALEDHNGVPMLSAITCWQDPSEPSRVARRREISSRKYPYNGESLWNTTGFEEAFWTARTAGNSAAMERCLRYAYAARSLSPCWWWYGVDKRWTEFPSTPPHPAMADSGEMCLGPTTVSNSLLYLASLDRDSDRINQTWLRMAFGGLASVWALVRPDGGAAMGFCPDVASKQFGYSWTTGDVGIGLYNYLRSAASIVLASRIEGLQTFGCDFETLDEGPDERFRLKPWDGVGRRIVIRHVGLEVTARNARIRELEFDAAKRNATLTMRNSSDKELDAVIEVAGLWGDRFEVNGVQTTSENGKLLASVKVPARSMEKVVIKVLG